MSDNPVNNDALQYGAPWFSPLPVFFVFLWSTGFIVAKFGLAGVVVLAKVVLALLSITAGSMYQRRFCPRFDLRIGTVIQFAATIAVLLPLAVLVEDFDLALSAVAWTPGFIGALLWSVLGLSIGAIFLLFKLIRRSAATEVTSLLYLTPPTTALMAWLAFGERFSLPGIAGMAVAVIGVLFVVKK